LASEWELRVAEVELATLEGEIARRDETHDLATRIINAVQDAGLEAVVNQLSTLEPLVTRIFARMGSHPLLTRILIDAVVANRKGRLSIAVSESSDQKKHNPIPVLSSSQLNALA